jgi:RHS repeat-associated protein
LYGYDSDGDRTSVTDPAGNVTETTVDADGRPLTVTQGYGTSAASKTSYAYDIKPGSGACSSSVSGALYCTTTTDPTGETTVTYMNVRDLPMEVASPESGTSTMTYDASGNPLATTTNGGTATDGYNADEELTSISYSSPQKGFSAASNVSYSYDADGNRLAMTDGTGTTSYGYDSLERLTSLTNGAGAESQYGYDSDSELTSITYPGSTGAVTQAYDSAGRETSVKDWLGNTTNFSYDADGNVTSEAYPNSTTATMAYNPDNGVTSIADAANSSPSSPFASMAYTYDADSRIGSETDTGLPGSSSVSYTYNPLSQVTAAGSAGFAYDTAGDPTTLGAETQAFNSAHQITSQSSGTSQNQTISRVGTTSGGDSGTGTSLKLTLPSGVVANDQILLAVTLPGNDTLPTTPTGYTEVGSEKTGTSSTSLQMVLYRRTAQAGDSSVTVTFASKFAKAATLVVYSGVNPSTPIDVSSNETVTSGTSVTVPSATTTSAGDEMLLSLGALASKAGTFTAPSGTTTRVTQAGGTTIENALADETLGAAGATGSQKATFSTTGALIGMLVTLHAASNNTTYAYDSLGDRTSVTTPSGSTAIGYNQLGQMVSDGTAAYTYNGDGLEATKKIGSGTTEQFTWGQTTPDAQVPQLLEDGSTYYIYGPDGTPLEQITGSTPTYYLHDQLGSTRALTNSSGAATGTFTYNSYGGIQASTGTATTTLGYAGQYTDPTTGLTYLRARWYDPATGQFTSVDPLQQLTDQPYTYASDNPINYTDPSGRCGALCVIGVVAGGASMLTGIGEIAAGAGLLGEAAVDAEGALGAVSAVTGVVGAASDASTCIHGGSGSGISCVGAVTGSIGAGAGLAAASGLLGDTAGAGVKAIGIPTGAIGAFGDAAGAVTGC